MQKHVSTGEESRRARNQQFMSDVSRYPLSDADHRAAKVFVCVTVPLMALAIATLVARITFKVRSSLQFGWDDYLLIIGSIFAVADWAIITDTIACYIPPSLSLITLTDLEYTIKLGIVAIPLWSVSIACIKVGVAIQLLRFQQSRLWKIVLFLVIGLITSTAIAFCLFDLFQCIPLAAAWDATIVEAKCVSTDTFRVISNIQSSSSITTDLILSLFPLTFLRKLRRPMTERVLIYVLMAMGITASAASIYKAVLLIKWVHAIDSFQIGFTISLWTCVEMFIGIIAACVPTLKPLFQKVLTGIGIDFTFESSVSFYSSYDSRTFAIEEEGRSDEGVKTDRLVSLDGTECSDKSGAREKSRLVSDT